MKETTKNTVGELIERYPALESCRADMDAAVAAIVECYRADGKILTCGNGGSAADAEHIVGELMKGFLKKRPLDEGMQKALREDCPDAEYLIKNLQGTLSAISLVDQVAINTAFANDQAPDLCMAQQVLGLGKKGDVLIAISTSGNSKNVVYACEMARAKGMKTIALTGESGGKLKDFADICIRVPSDETYKIQEYHLPVYHMLCIAAEEEFFEK